MDLPASDPEPQPWSPAWAATPAAARWRAAQPAPAADYVGPLVERLNYPTFLTALRPPPHDAVPVLDAQSAYRSARAHGQVPTDSGGPTIFLAIADVRETRGVLVYVLRWEAVRWTPSGPPPPVGKHRHRREAIGPCIALIDATTGACLATMLMGAEVP